MTMALRTILQLGDPRLREVAPPVKDPSIPEIAALVKDLARHAGALAVDNRLRTRHRRAATRRAAAGYFFAIAGRRAVAAGES